MFQDELDFTPCSFFSVSSDIKDKENFIAYLDYTNKNLIYNDWQLNILENKN